jgi:hypothetical protein
MVKKTLKKKKSKQIKPKTKTKLMLWCERHCCWCGKQCTTNIRIHHIDENPENDDIDNLVPLCSDCTDILPAYNDKHPTGTKFSKDEIKLRRNLIFDKYTSLNICPIEIIPSKFLLGYSQGKIFYQAYLNKEKNQIEPAQRAWGDISCFIKNLSPNLSAKLRLFVIPYKFNKNNPNIKGIRIKSDIGSLYSGKELWDLKPEGFIIGHFFIDLPKNNNYHLRLEFFYSVIDKVGREHNQPPFSYIIGDPFENWNSPQPDSDFYPHPTINGKDPFNVR